MQALLLRTLHWSRSCTSPWIQYWSNQLRPFLIVVVVVFVDCLSGGGDDDDYGGRESKCSNKQQRQQINNNRTRTLVTRLDWATGCFYKKRWKVLVSPCCLFVFFCFVSVTYRPTVLQTRKFPVCFHNLGETASSIRCRSCFGVAALIHLFLFTLLPVARWFTHAINRSQRLFTFLLAFVLFFLIRYFDCLVQYLPAFSSCNFLSSIFTSFVVCALFCFHFDFDVSQVFTLNCFKCNFICNNDFVLQ